MKTMNDFTMKGSFGEKTKDSSGEGRTIVFLEGIVIKMLVLIKEIYMMHLLYVLKKKYLDGETGKVKPRSKLEISKPAVGKKRPPLWKSGIDQSALASCFHDVHCRFFGNDETQEQLQGKHNDEVSLMAYLYIICEKEEFFESEEKRTFFNFCKTEAGFTTNVSDKTFRNRLSKMEGKLLPHPLLGVDKTANSNFQRIRVVFHGTKKYEAIRPQGKN